jgi:ribosomal protein L5
MNSGLQITIVTSADTDEDAKGLLEQVWIIFQKKVS